jgi:hypothetical protein
MDNSDEKQHSSSLDERALGVHNGHSGDELAVNNAYDTSTVNVDEKDEPWRDGWDDRRERRVLRKMDIHLLPFVSLLYLLSFL